MNSNKIYLILGIALLSFIGYKTYQYQQLLAVQPSRSSLITAEVERKLQNYRNTVFKNCNEDVLEDAKIIADSIIFVKSKGLMLIDSTGRPPKPIKPDTPLSIPLKDSTDVKPIVPNSVTNDEME